MTDHILSPVVDRLPRILVVEDDVAGAFLIDLQLDDIGCPHDIAKSAKEALSLMDKDSYDIILMNIRMPDMNGYELVKLIRDEEHKAQKPRQRIIAVTAHAYLGARQKCLECGMDDYLAKPYTPQMLKDTLLGKQKN